MLRHLFAATILASVVSVVGARDFAVGQVWTYHVRPGDEGSTLQINKIEESKLGTIYHISLFGLHIPSSHAPGGFITELPHLPVSAQTLEKSVESLASEPPRAVDYAPGYAEWKRAFDTGNGGIYTISVAEIAMILEKTWAARTQ